MQHEHLDLSTPRPCFRALNDLACMLNASKRYKKGISLEELMLRIEASLAGYRGYLILFVDEVDNVRRDQDTFLTFLVRRLPQRIPARLILVFVSNRLNWPDHLDPRVRSFLKLNELIFKPYDAVDLQHILKIRVEKALRPGAVEPGVVEKIAAMASQDHGDARQAVALLASSAYLAEKAGSTITLDLVDQAADQIEQDRYLTMLRTAPVQLQAAMAAVISAAGQNPGPARRHRRGIRRLPPILRPHRPAPADRPGLRRPARRTGHVLLPPGPGPVPRPLRPYAGDPDRPARRRPRPHPRDHPDPALAVFADGDVFPGRTDRAASGGKIRRSRWSRWPRRSTGWRRGSGTGTGTRGLS